MKVEVYTDVTKILKMAAADCLQPSVRSQNVFCEGESLSLHPTLRRSQQCGAVGSLAVHAGPPGAAKPNLVPFKFTEPRGWGKGGGIGAP